MELQNNSFFSSWIKPAWVATKRLYLGNYGYHASALAFITLLSLVPLFTVIIYIFTFFKRFNRLILATNTYINNNFLPNSNLSIQKYLYLFLDQATQLPALSIIFFLITSILLMLTIETTFNQIWLVKNKKRNFAAVLFAFGLFLLLPFFIGLSSLFLGYIDRILWLQPYQLQLLNISNIIINATIFSVFYVVIPNHTVTWRNGFIVGFLTALTFEIIKKLFTIYVSHIANYELIYGTLAILPIFLLWVYTCWYMVLYGALLLHAKDHHDQHLNHDND